MANSVARLASVATPRVDDGYVPGDENNRSQIIQDLFARYDGPLRRNLAATLQSDAEARDVAQEAYLRILQLKQLDTVSHLRAYLFRTASNIAIDRLRKRKVREEAARGQIDALEDLLTTPGPERIVLGGQHLDLLKSALLELPEKCRVAFALHFFAEKTVAETAAELGLSARMVRYYLARGLAHCRQSLDGIVDDRYCGTDPDNDETA